MRNTPGNPHVCSPEISPNTDELGDVTDTYPHMEPDVETSSKQPQKSPTDLAVPNKTYVITRSPTAMTTTDISLSAQQVCSTWRARSRSTISRNALRGTYVVVQIFLHTPTVAIPWRLTHMLLSLDNPKTRPLILNSVIFFSLHRPTLFHFTSHYFLLIYLSVMARSTIYININ